MPTTGTSIENGATVLDGCRPISAVHSPLPTSVATTTVKSSPAEREQPLRAAEVLERPGDRRGTLDDQRQRQQRQRRHDRHPQQQPERLAGLRLHGTAVAQVADRPAEPAAEGQQHRDQGRAAGQPGPVRGDARQADDGEQDPGALPGGDALAQEHPRQHAP